MKTFLNYSGKGGVGKSTITYCMYMAFKELGYKVSVLDMDLNTPSMQHLVSDEDLVSNYKFKGLFLDKATINLFLKKAINQIRNSDIDILLIDTPPSITDVHMSIIKKLKISASILVSQPTILSKSDVERTVPFFENEGITVVGIIENMVEETSLDYTYNKLLSIPKSKGLDSKVVYLDNADKFKSLSEKLLNMNLEDVSQDNKIRTIFDDTISWNDVKSMYHISEDEDGEYGLYRHPLAGSSQVSNLKFVNVETWKHLHPAICDIQDRGNSMLSSGFTDRTDCVKEATFERVERLVRAFESDETVLFMIVKNPTTVVPTIVGEIASCTLKIDDKFNGIPTVEYITEQGTIRLFPHEVTPVTSQILRDIHLDGYLYVEGGKRIIPSLDIAMQYGFTFGSRVGMPETEESIEKLWLSVGGKK